MVVPTCRAPHTPQHRLCRRRWRPALAPHTRGNCDSTARGGTKEVVPQQALQQFPPPGTGPVQLPGWPRDVPEVHDREVRETLAEQGGAERQVVILEPDKGALVTT